MLRHGEKSLIAIRADTKCTQGQARSVATVGAVRGLDRRGTARMVDMPRRGVLRAEQSKFSADWQPFVPRQTIPDAKCLS